MITKTTLPLALVMFVTLAVALPVSAEEADSTTEVVTTSTEGTAVQKSAMTKNKGAFEKLLEQWRLKLAAKKGSTTAETKKAGEDRGLGNAMKSASSSCIMELVDDREVAIQEAWTKFNTSIADALKARQTALYAAWGKEDTTERSAGVKAAMKSWGDAHKVAFRKLKEERKSAWANYKNTARSECKVTVPAEDKLSSDGSGSVAL